jgi:hypothetical protein
LKNGLFVRLIFIIDHFSSPSEVDYMFAREGIPMDASSALPGMIIAQRPPTPGKFAVFAAKLQKVMKRGYFEEGDVWSLIDMFDAPKGLDIRVVCNVTLSGFNAALWAPSFFLPSGSAALRVVTFTALMLGADIGEMFLNLPMHKFIRPYAGIDIQQF